MGTPAAALAEPREDLGARVHGCLRTGGVSGLENRIQTKRASASPIRTGDALAHDSRPAATLPSVLLPSAPCLPSPAFSPLPCSIAMRDSACASSSLSNFSTSSRLLLHRLRGGLLSTPETPPKDFAHGNEHEAPERHHRRDVGADRAHHRLIGCCGFRFQGVSTRPRTRQFRERNPMPARTSGVSPPLMRSRFKSGCISFLAMAFEGGFARNISRVFCGNGNPVGMSMGGLLAAFPFHGWRGSSCPCCSSAL